MVAVCLIGCHVVLLHRTTPSKNSTCQADGVETLLLVLVKDFVICCAIVAFIFHDSVKTLVHPDN